MRPLANERTSNSRADSWLNVLGQTAPTGQLARAEARPRLSSRPLPQKKETRRQKKRQRGRAHSIQHTKFAGRCQDQWQVRLLSRTIGIGQSTDESEPFCSMPGGGAFHLSVTKVTSNPNYTMRSVKTNFLDTASSISLLLLTK